jgi:hypothetical protein
MRRRTRRIPRLTSRNNRSLPNLGATLFLRTGRGGVVPAIARSFRVALLQSRQFKVMLRDLAVALSHVGSLHCTEVSQQNGREGSFTTEMVKAEVLTCPLRSDSDRQPSKRDPSLWANKRHWIQVFLKSGRRCVEPQPLLSPHDHRLRGSDP